MLSEKDIQEHKELIEERNSLAQEINNIIAVGQEKKKQGLEIMKSFGYSSLKDIDKLKEEEKKLEEEIKQERIDAENDIAKFSKIKEEVDNIMVK